MREWYGLLRPWRGWLEVRGCSAKTVELRLCQLRRFAREIGKRPWSVTLDDLTSWISSHSTWGRDTRRSYACSLRSFYAWAVVSGRCESSPAAHLPRLGSGAHRPRPVPRDVYEAAYAKADDRVRLILTLAVRLGMRRGEIARCHAGDLLEGDTGWSLLVRGKGGKDRLMPCPRDVARLIAQHGPGFVLPGNDHGHLSPAYVGKLASRVLPGNWTLHTLRHAFGTRAWRVSRDLAVVQDLMGNASPATTRICVQTDDAARRAVVEQLA